MSVQIVSRSVLLPFMLLAMLGWGAGMTRSAEPPREKVLFEEKFTETPGKGWSWLREMPSHWKIDKERNELLICPVWSVGNLKNIPLWTIPNDTEGPIAMEVHVDHVPNGDYEYAGLIWYLDNDNFVDIRKGPHGEEGKILHLRRVKEGKPEIPKKLTYNDPAVDLRMVVAGAKAQGWYRASSTEEWQSLGEVEMPSSGSAKVGLRTGNGEGGKPSWVRFSKFRILQIDR